MKTALATGLLLAAPAAFAQSDAPPAFEVASVRASQIAKAGGKGSRRQSIQTEPGNLIMRNVALTNAVRWAYGVQEFQVAGPGWTREERYDIVAKSADKAPDEQMKRMLQALLADRFKMTVHREEKVMAYYILTVAKGGLKLKESAGEGEPDVQPGPNRATAVAQHMTPARFCELLSQILRAPVLDETGLKGQYDATLDLAPLIAAYPQGPSPEEVPAMIMNGIQDMLGLKLDSKKGPVNMVVVDRAEKIPTEN